MYALFHRHLPKPAAAAVAVAWYAMLLVLVLYSVFEPQAEFQCLAL